MQPLAPLSAVPFLDWTHDWRVAQDPDVSNERHIEQSPTRPALAKPFLGSLPASEPTLGVGVPPIRSPFRLKPPAWASAA